MKKIILLSILALVLGCGGGGEDKDESETTNTNETSSGTEITIIDNNAPVTINISEVNASCRASCDFDCEQYEGEVLEICAENQQSCITANSECNITVNESEQEDSNSDSDSEDDLELDF